MNELDGVLALLVAVLIALVWLGYEARKLRDAIEPIAESSLARAISGV